MLLILVTAVLLGVIPVSALNQKPYFVETLATLLEQTGIYENTTRGTVLGRISCVDPDGDRVVYYAVDTTSIVVDKDTGVVKLNKDLDREQQSNTQSNDKPNSVTFQCNDVDANGTEKSIPRPRVDLVITVLDNNDEIPEFMYLRDGYTFYVKEDAPVGTVLDQTISVKDRDRGANARLSSLSLFCSPSDLEPCEFFTIRERQTDEEGLYTANVILQRPLDYETRTDYRTQIRAIDSGLDFQNTASAGIRIVVNDSQDTNPIFTNPEFTFEVQEGLSPNTILTFEVSARDGDRGAKRPVILEILPNANGIDLFRTGNSVLINNVTGIYAAPLIVNREIDREIDVSSIYTFTAKATELMRDGSRSNATVEAVFTANILDLNDNSPLFSQSVYTVTVPEMNQRTGVVQLPNPRIEVSDNDEPSNAQYIMEIQSQTFPGAFGFTPDTQVSGTQIFHLTVNNFQYMDYDEQQYRSQVVVLKAVEILSSNQRGSRSSSATVSVFLTDINDNFPVFSRNDYEGSIVENAANFTSILTVSATDADSGINSQFTYSLDSSVRDTFYINPNTGVLRLVGHLDYETLTEYSFFVFAVDISKTAQALVRVRVTDYNDVGPQFLQDTYSARVTETSTQFESPVRVQAEDPSDPGARITYRILSGNTPTNSFVLDPNTGNLTLRETVNFEQTPNRTGIFSLLVQASDNGVPEEVATTRVTVTVQDENNHSPVFNPTQYYKTVPETIAPDTFLLQVTATDDDFGSNGQISYRIGTGGRDDVVVSRDGAVSVSNFPQFDYDQLQQLTVQIIASDGGSPQRSATATAYITVTDANNKAPVFAENLYAAIVDEADPVGTLVLTLSATDPDSQHTLRYSINNASIVAINKGGAQLGSINPYNYMESFAVNPVTGALTVNQELDRNYVEVQAFDVIVTDVHPSAVGRQSSSARVTITITGQPDTQLYFNQPWTTAFPVYEVPILESSPVGTEIMTLQARDPIDASLLTDYREVPGSDPNGYFSVITKTDPISGTTPGVVVLNRALDYDMGDLLHSVVVIAVKGATNNVASRTATATVIIQVQDFNDNAPVFTRTLYKFTVREDAAINSQVGVITARDRDSASFGPIEFTLGGSLDSNDFQLYQPPDQDGTAILLVKNPLDFERITSYTIDIIATDNPLGRGSAIRQDSRAVVIVDVLDVNDNTPTFSDASRSFSVPETASPSTRLGQVLAADTDYGQNGAITYSLGLDPAYNTQAQSLSLFGITELSGLLYTRSSLRGRSGTYRFLVVARDGGTSPKSASIPVSIKVQGAEDNDGTPLFLEPDNDFVVRFPEHERGQLPVRFHAIARSGNGTDPNAITYSLAPFGSYYDYFLVDSVLGNVSVIGDLDYEIQQTYTIVVEATDTNDTTKISRRTIIVELIDIDDNVASFKKSPYAACPNDLEVPTVYSTPDNTPAGVIVGHAVACDPDGPNNNHINYYRYTGSSLCAATDVGAFEVLSNGSLKTLRMLNYEDQTEFLVCVRVGSPNTRRKRAFDVGQMNNTDITAYIVIKVVDLNDNGPSFPDRDITAVLQTLPTERAVTQVTATDPDGPLNNQVRYSITGTMYYPPSSRAPYPLRMAFDINPNNGVIYTNLPSYDDFARGYFLVTVTAFDVQNQLFNDTATVMIYVYQRSQVLRVVLDKPPSQGIQLADNLIRDLNQVDRKNQFFLRSTTERRTASGYVSTQTDVCFVLVENNQPTDATEGISILDTAEFRDVLRRSNYSMVDRGVCYVMRSSETNVKWRDLWWVLVIVAIFIFICVFILIVTICLLYDRYKSYMETQHTSLVPQ